MPNSNAKTTEQKQNIEEAYQKAEKATVEAVDQLKDQAEEKLAAGSESVKNVTSQAESIIKQRPLLSIGCAFLAGWAVSKLIK
ncbi:MULTISPECIES: hypothetical protein [Vibrio]|uniref:DUF883 family protein n=1 Tax=Vibrio casei TaxID=673372 RepID=A0A368LIQ9_9VIBR|nr:MULTISPECIES: hypothetical protein [Vibrio]RCS70632.1 hypothetical protein CIK83_14545 [Vibrio casei]SJN27167.1 hypothetical protein FM109_07340 [Vibrio casei]HBV77764.1 hypothetical protein [Vibrio sp.]